MNPELLDGEQVVNALLIRGLPEEIDIAADLDVNSIDELPCLTYTLNGDGQSENGPGLFTYTLTLSAFGDGLDQTFALAKAVYACVWSWDQDPQLTHVINDETNRLIGWVEDVEDVSSFSRVGSVDMVGKLVTQYVGVFSLTLRNQ